MKLLLLLSSFSSLTNCFSNIFFSRPNIDDRLEHSGYDKKNVTSYWFKQKIDHFNPYYTGYFNQRYFIDNQYYKDGGPIFLLIGGESQITANMFYYNFLFDAAKEYQGAVVALEHRYYGESQPRPNLTLSNLKFLSTRQALADIKNFIEIVKLPLNVKNSRRWIVAGYSYPGNLAIWSRMLYPYLISGAIASSAPVQAKANFFEYDLQVQKNILHHGGEQCLNAYKLAFQEVDKVLLSGNRDQIDKLKDRFGCKEVDDGIFADSLNYPGFMYAQMDNSGERVKDLCDSLMINSITSAPSALDSFISQFKGILATNKVTCQKFNDISEYANVIQPKEKYVRQWNYQYCTEFGYFQAPPPKPYSALRSRFADLNFLKRMYCKDIFGPNGPSEPHTQLINLFYGAKFPLVTNVFATSGELDPWMPLCITRRTLGVDTFMIKGGAHCADYERIEEADLPQVKEAKLLSLEHIKKWL